MKTILSLSLACWLSLLIHAQTTNIDSLKQLLAIENHDSTKAKLLAQLSNKYAYRSPDTAFFYASKGRDLAYKINFPKGEAECLNAMSFVLSLQGNDVKALDMGLQALRIADSINNPLLLLRCLNSVAFNYHNRGDDINASIYCKHALDIATAIKNEFFIGFWSANLGDNYSRINKLDSARFYTEQGYNIAVKTNNPGAIGVTLNNLGNIYAKMQQPDVAMANYKLALPYLFQSNNNDGICEAALGMATLFKQKNRNDSALYYARLSLTTAQKNKFAERILDASKFLADYFRQNHLTDSAYVYLQQVVTSKDSLFDQEKTRSIQNLTFDETLRQQEIANTKLAEQKEHNTNIQYALITVGLISFIIIFLLLSQSVIVNEKWISFLGILGLLLLFEFINLFLHPYIEQLTNHSPLYMLGILVAIASLLIPLHHRIEYWIKDKMVSKNKKIRLAAAKRTIQKLERENKTE